MHLPDSLYKFARVRVFEQIAHCPGLDCRKDLVLQFRSGAAQLIHNHNFGIPDRRWSRDVPQRRLVEIVRGGATSKPTVAAAVAYVATQTTPPTEREVSIVARDQSPSADSCQTRPTERIIRQPVAVVSSLSLSMGISRSPWLTRAAWWGS